MNKDEIAQNIFGYDYDALSGAEKNRVTRTYNSQEVVEESNSGVVKATIGRLADNGSKTCMLNEGSNFEDLLDQAEFDFDEEKEKIVDVDTGEAVDLDDLVKHNGTYAISVEIKSA